MHAPDVSPPNLGDVFSARYRIEELIAHGGMGVVYRGVQLAMSRDVAIKMIRPDALDFDRAAARFRREVAIGKELRHPHVVELYDYGDEPGGLYVVMELLEGADLKETLARDGPMSLGRSCDIVLQALDALAEAHRRGFVHRDIKPSNIFLTQRGDRTDFVKLLDFGVARGVEEHASDITRHGEVCGTSAYMAPEMFLQGTIGQAVDVYAMGLILLECFRGRKVVDGRTAAEMLMLHVRKRVEIPERFAATPVAEVIRRAVGKTPERRYPNAADMRRELQRALEHSDPSLQLAEPVPPDAEVAVGDLLDDMASLINTSGAIDVRDGGSSDVVLTTESRDILTSDQFQALLADTSELRALADGGRSRRWVLALAAITVLVGGAAIASAIIDSSPSSGAGHSDPVVGTTTEQTDGKAVVAGVTRDTGHREVTSADASGAPRQPSEEPTADEDEKRPHELPQKDESPGSDDGDEPELEWVPITLKTQPPGAKVYRDGELIGNAPVRVQLPADGPPVTYRFKAPGHASVMFKVDPSVGAEDYEVSLPMVQTERPTRPPDERDDEPNEGETIWGPVDQFD